MNASDELRHLLPWIFQGITVPEPDSDAPILRILYSCAVCEPLTFGPHIEGITVRTSQGPTFTATTEGGTLEPMMNHDYVTDAESARYFSDKLEEAKEELSASHRENARFRALLQRCLDENDSAHAGSPEGLSYQLAKDIRAEGFE